MRYALLFCALLVPGTALAQTGKSKSGPTATTPTKAPENRPLTQDEKDAAAAAGAAGAAAGAGILGMGLLCSIVAVVASLLAYFLPTFIAVVRKHTNLAPILIVNIFFGWSLIGWVVALAWAFAAQEPRYARRRSRDDDDNPFN